GLAMIALHVYVRRRPGEGFRSDASLAALVGAISVPSGLIALMWDSGIANTSVVLFFPISRDGIGNGLVVASGVFAAAYVLAREARWLLVAPLALVAGIEAHLLGSGQISSIGGGSWTRFLFLLAASTVLTSAAGRAPGSERHNLLVAAALIVPFAFL